MTRFLIGLSCFIYGSACTSSTPPPALVHVASQSEGQPIVTDTVRTDTMRIEYLLGKFEPSQEQGFVRIEDVLTGGNARGSYLRKEALDAFRLMHAAARKEGITLTILSATRNFTYQKGIWESKWEGKRLVEGKNLAQAFANDPVGRARMILRFSAMPGASRHHWGTDIDLNAFENAYFGSGEGLKVFRWLEAHAAEYGFCRPYTAKGPARPAGYEEEKWHWSYMPVAGPLLAQFSQLTEDQVFAGFLGAETAPELHIIREYVMGIDPGCK